MSRISNKGFYGFPKRIPGRGFLKNFFKVHGPIRTIKGAFFYYYSELKLKNLHLDPAKSHTVNVNGYNMLIIPMDRGISAELVMFNSHEPLTTKLLLSVLKEGMVCLDIGSNIGYYAILESKIVGTKGTVICIEPSPLNFQYLKKNLEKERQSIIETYNIAVGDANGYTDFLATSQSNLSRALKENEEVPLANGQNKLISVPIRQVDSLINEIRPEKLNFIRMDPEGYEASIYHGMKDTLRRYFPMLLIEFHRNYLGIQGTKNLLHELKDDGYESIYYIPRWMDNPIIANPSYVQRKTIDHLLKKLDRDALPAGFNLFLVNERQELISSRSQN